MIKIGDYVSRNSYNNDIIFQVIDIKKDKCILKGADLRILADSKINDLKNENYKKCDEQFEDYIKMNRSDYFYIPGKILHFDADKDYLSRCIEYYKKNNVPFIAKLFDESEMYKHIKEEIDVNMPDIIVITGHDSYTKNNDKYKNSENFTKAVIQARKLEKSNENLKIIAGACQSNYDALIKAGATFASSPKKINIHALDPAIIAVSLSLMEKEKSINLQETLSKTKYGKDGIGGLKSFGTMYVGYPRNGDE